MDREEESGCVVSGSTDNEEGDALLDGGCRES